MKHYLTAEWGRAVARPYFRIFLLVLLALAAGLPLLWRFGLGDMFQGSFGDSLSLLTPLFHGGPLSGGGRGGRGLFRSI